MDINQLVLDIKLMIERGCGSEKGPGELFGQIIEEAERARGEKAGLEVMGGGLGGKRVKEGVTVTRLRRLGMGRGQL